MRTVVATSFVAALLICCPTAHAQARRVHWGVSGSLAPSWKVPPAFEALFDADSVSVKGSEFQIGFVRGSIMQGDWGVSFVHKSIKDGSHVDRLQESGCQNCGTFFTTSDASLDGVEVHRFIPFGVIQRRVQIGMNVGGGVGKMRGTAHQTTVSAEGSSAQDVEASVLFAPGGTEFKAVPLGRLEIAVAVILGPDVKVRVSGGFDFPGYDKINIAVVYLFGAR